MPEWHIWGWHLLIPFTCINQGLAPIVFLALFTRGPSSGAVHLLLVPLVTLQSFYTTDLEPHTFKMHKWCAFLMIMGEGECEKQGEKVLGKNLGTDSLKTLHVHVFPLTRVL